MTNGIYSGYEKFEFVVVVGKEVVKSGLANNHNKVLELSCQFDIF